MTFPLVIKLSFVILIPTLYLIAKSKFFYVKIAPLKHNDGSATSSTEPVSLACLHVLYFIS